MMLSKDELKEMLSVVEALRVLKNTNIDKSLEALVLEVQELRARVARLEAQKKGGSASSAKTKDVMPSLLTVPQFVEKHPCAKSGGIRHLIFHADTNGFDKCIVRMGRRVLLNEEKVYEWLQHSG